MDSYIQIPEAADVDRQQGKDYMSSGFTACCKICIILAPKVCTFVEINCLLQSLTLEATPLERHLSKGLTNLAMLPNYKRSWKLSLPLPPHQKVSKPEIQIEYFMSKII